MRNAGDLSELLDNLFHSAALAAFVEQSRHQQSWPCPDATKRLAYRHYEMALATKNGHYAAGQLGNPSVCELPPDT